MATWRGRGGGDESARAGRASHPSVFFRRVRRVLQGVAGYNYRTNLPLVKLIRANKLLRN
jgi:hypothetical protein